MHSNPMAQGATGTEMKLSAFDVHPGMIVDLADDDLTHVIHVKRDADTEKVVIVGLVGGDDASPKVVSMHYCDAVVWHMGQAA